MRTRQFKRLGSLLINQPFGENLLPEAGLSRKKQKNTNQRRPSNASIYPKLQKLNVFGVDMPVDETLYSIDQINLEVKSAQARKLSEFGYQLQQRKKFRWFYGGLSTKHARRCIGVSSPGTSPGRGPLPLWFLPQHLHDAPMDPAQAHPSQWKTCGATEL